MRVERRREGGRRMSRQRTLVCSTTRVRLQLIACAQFTISYSEKERRGSQDEQTENAGMKHHQGQAAANSLRTI